MLKAAIILLLLASLGLAAPLRLYVSPQGNDAWNGRTATRRGTRNGR